MILIDQFISNFIHGLEVQVSICLNSKTMLNLNHFLDVLISFHVETFLSCCLANFSFQDPVVTCYMDSNKCPSNIFIKISR